MNTVCDPLHTRRRIVCSRNWRLKSGLRIQSEGYASDRLGSIATVSTAAVVTSRHDQCLINLTVGAKSTDTVAVAAKADGRSDTTQQYHLSKVTLAPQCSYLVVVRHPKHRSQLLDSRRCEAKYNAFFAFFWCIINKLLSMFHLARSDFRQAGYEHLLPWEETTKSIN